MIVIYELYIKKYTLWNLYILLEYEELKYILNA